MTLPDEKSAQSGGPECSSPGQGIPYDRFLDCVHCGLCTSACPTYLETGNENDSPRGRIYLMRSVVDGQLELTEGITRHLDLCLDCRSCETACPSGVQYGRLIEPFRVDMRKAVSQSAEQTSRRWFERLFLFGLFPYRRRLGLALAPARWMQRIGINPRRLSHWLPSQLRRLTEQLPDLEPQGPALPEVVPAHGQRRARVGLFTGCVADAMFRHVHHATVRVLQANGCEVVIPARQVCCGAIHYHNGAADPALELAAQNLAAFQDKSLDAIIVNVAGCGSMLKDYGEVARELNAPTELAEQLGGLAMKFRDVSEFLSDLGLADPPHAVPMKATYHDACHLVHAQRVRDQPRELLSCVKELELVDLPESEVCCGAAGSYNLTEPEMADRLGRRKLAHIESTGADAVILGNAGCSLQIQASMRRAGCDLPVLHPMEILDRAYHGSGPSDSIRTAAVNLRDANHDR